VTKVMQEVTFSFSSFRKDCNILEIWPDELMILVNY